MGKALSLLKTWKEPIVPEDNESIDRAIEHILEQPEDMVATMETYLALKVVNLHLIKRMIASLNSEKQLYLNRVPLQMLHTGKFKSCLKKLFKHWLTVHTEVNSKAILLVKSFDVQYLEVLAKFLLLMSEKRTLRVMDDLKYFKLEPITEGLVQTKNIPQKNTESSLFPLYSFIEMQTQTECEAAYITLRNTLSSFLKLKTSFLTRSDNTLEILSYMAEHTFVLLVRIYFHREHHPEIREFVLKETPEEAVRFGAYFLAKSVDIRKDQLFDLTVRFLLSLIYDGRITKEMPSFPSPLFPNIPVLIENNLFQFILWNLLLGLSRYAMDVKEGEKITRRMMDRLTVDRFESWRLIIYLLENKQAHMEKLSIYFLEELALSVKVSDIERIYLNKMIRFALKIQRSEILEKFLKSYRIDYTLNFSNHRLVLNYLQISEYLNEKVATLSSTIDFYSERYLYGAIFQKRVEPNWTELVLWNNIKARLHTTHSGIKYHTNGVSVLESKQLEVRASNRGLHYIEDE